MPKKILVVDDEKPISDIIKSNLTKKGPDVDIAYDGEKAIKKADGYDPDLMILDLMLPKKDGLEVVQEVRQTHNMPIIMVTVKDTGINKVLRLEMGVDDYVTEPFFNRELVARIKANLRKCDLTQEATGDDEDKNITINNLVVIPEAYTVEKNGEKTELTRREFELLHYLTRYMGQVMTREHSLQTVWGYDHFGDVGTVDVTVRHLREKTGDNPSLPIVLVTRRGVGYYVKNPSNGQGSESLVIVTFFAIGTNEENKKCVKFYQFQNRSSFYVAFINNN